MSHIAIIVCVFLNIIQDSVTTRTVGSSGLLSGIYLRHNMGFLIHNQIPLTFMLLYLSMIAWKKEKLKLSTNLVVVIANYFLFKNVWLTNSLSYYLYGLSILLHF